jgi:hypothetical protein
MSVQMAERLASYATAGLDDQAFLNEPFLRVFQRGSASRTAQQLQVSRLTKEDLLLYAPDMVPKGPRDYYTNVFPARKIIENPEICYAKGTKSIVKITENLPVGDYSMKEWNDFIQTVRAIGGRPVIQTLDEPLHATNVGWCAELMDLAEAGANRPLDPDSIDDGSYGFKAKAAGDMWFAVSKIVTNILRHYGAHIPEGGDKRNHGCYVDSGGWVLLDIILEWINGMACEMQQAECRQLSTETSQPGTVVRSITHALCRRKVTVDGISPSRISSGLLSLATRTGSRSCALCVLQRALPYHDGFERGKGTPCSSLAL